MKKLALFDMDGTLFDTKEVNFKAYQEAFKEQGYELKYADFQKYCLGRQFKDFMPNLIPNNKDVYPIIHKRKKELYPKYLKMARVNQHLINMARMLKKDYTLAIVTTASLQNTMDILNNFELFDLFDFLITGEDVKMNKPDPECYFKAIEKAKVPIEDVIIFEDSKPGIMAAEQTGATVFIIDKF